MGGRGWLAVLLLSTHLGAGCTIQAPFGTRDLGPPPPESLRAGLGPLAVRLSSENPIGLFDAPTAGKIRGMKKGFGMGAEAWADTSQNVQGGGLLYLLTLPGFMLVGAVTGLIRAPSEAAVLAATENLIAALAERDVPAEFEPFLVEALRDRAQLDFTLLAPGAETPADASYVLHIGIESVSLSERGLDPTIPLVVRCRARLVTASRGTVYETAIDFAWNRIDFTGWGADDGAALHAELARAYPHLAEGVVEELFLVHAPYVKRRAQ